MMKRYHSRAFFNLTMQKNRLREFYGPLFAREFKKINFIMAKFFALKQICLETKLNYINAFDKVPRSDKLTATLIRLVCSTFRIFRFTTYPLLDIYFYCKEENNYLQKLYSTYKVDINETNLLRLIIRKHFRR